MKYIFEAIADELKVMFGDKTKDKLYTSQRTYTDDQEAVRAFELSVKKLFDVEKWSLLPGATSTFELYDKNGQRKKDQTPVVGDFIRILLPGPLPENWVQVIDINKNERMAEFTVRPSRDPKERNDDVEHFFISKATSTFRVLRDGSTIGACEIGKNEGVNTEDTDSKARKVINTVVAEGGWAGFQKIQWEKLTDYLTHQEEVKDK